MILSVFVSDTPDGTLVDSLRWEPTMWDRFRGVFVGKYRVSMRETSGVWCGINIYENAAGHLSGVLVAN